MAVPEMLPPSVIPATVVLLAESFRQRQILLGIFHSIDYPFEITQLKGVTQITLFFLARGKIILGAALPI